MSKLVANLASTRKRIRSEKDDDGNDNNPLTASNLKKARKGGKSGKGSPEDPSNVIYVGHLPQGFLEKEIRGFFSQFGEVEAFKLFRSKKTNGSKGYAFVKMESVSVAKTVSEAVDGYMVGDRRLVSHVITNGNVHEGMFLPPKKRGGSSISDTVSECFSDISAATYDPAKAGQKRDSRLKKKAAALRKAGIDFDVFAVNAANVTSSSSGRNGKGKGTMSADAAAPAAPTATNEPKKGTATAATAAEAAAVPKKAAKAISTARAPKTKAGGAAEPATAATPAPKATAVKASTAKKAATVATAAQRRAKK